MEQLSKKNRIVNRVISMIIGILMGAVLVVIGSVVKAETLMIQSISNRSTRSMSIPRADMTVTFFS